MAAVESVHCPLKEMMAGCQHENHGRVSLAVEVLEREGKGRKSVLGQTPSDTWMNK
jgi:hypothetical protein